MAYRPRRWFGNRWNYFYSRTKLATDPLYPAVAEALRGSSAALLDLGCGIGLLALALRHAGIELPYRGVDFDAAKIAQARRAAGRTGLVGVDFEVVDLARGLPGHSGSVALLDVLQYLDPGAQARLLAGAIGMLGPGGRLVIRSGFDDGGARIRTTSAFDRFANRLGWMKTPPQRYPREDELRATLERAGLRSHFRPLRGNMPFNNFLVVAERD
ncbi:MAG: class I SAM-dependent methyltransferase [Lysobacter sp.]|nr:class I SAM-dependent methyltransferase [Lysobacter sp.]